MAKKSGNIAIIVLICLCSVLLGASLLGAFIKISGEGKTSSGISNNNVSLGGKVTALYVVKDTESIVYNDNSIYNFNELLPERIVMYGNSCGSAKYLVNSNLGINSIKYSDLAAMVTFKNEEQESLGLTVDDYLQVYFDYGYVTFVQVKTHVDIDFNVRIFCVADESIYVDVEVSLINGMLYGFDDDDMYSSTHDEVKFWVDIQTVLGNTVCKSSVGGALPWSYVQDYSSIVDTTLHSDNARFAKVVFKNVNLSPDCKLLGASLIDGQYEWVEVVNVPGTWNMDHISDLDSNKVVGDWCIRDLYSSITFTFDYNAESSELSLLIVVDSYSNYGSDIFDEVSLSDGTYCYRYQERILEFFNFAQDPGYGSGSDYGTGQGSIGWFGGDFYVEG